MRTHGIQYKTDDQILAMRSSGLLTRAALDAVRDAIRPGITTAELDAIAEVTIRNGGGEPNFLGYQGYPASICISVNDVVVHGIPGQQRLEEGDIVSLDCGAVINGWHGDSAITVGVGSLSDADADLVETTRLSMWAGIAAMDRARKVGEIGEAVEECALSRHPEYGVLEDYVGHGIGTAMHQPPDVLNYASRDRGPKLREGMCLCIEPMITAGGIETRVLADEWTVMTSNGARAAHWEHTVAKHAGGIWVLTEPDGGAAELASRGVKVAPLD